MQLLIIFGPDAELEMSYILNLGFCLLNISNLSLNLVPQPWTWPLHILMRHNQQLYPSNTLDFGTMPLTLTLTLMLKVLFPVWNSKCKCVFLVLYTTIAADFGNIFLAPP